MLKPVSLTEDYWRDRGPFLARLYQQHGPVVRAAFARTDVVFLLGPMANQVVLQTHRHAFSHRRGWDRFFGRPASPPNLLTMDEPEHAWHRRLLHPAFAIRRLDGYLPLIARAIDRRLEQWASRATLDMYEETRVIAFDVAAEAFLGIRPGAERALGRAVFLHGAHHRDEEFTALLRRKIAERRASPGDDALGLLAQARDAHGDPLCDAQLLAHADILLVAGYETSASLGAWALYLLARHPDHARRILDEIAPDVHGRWVATDEDSTDRVPALRVRRGLCHPTAVGGPIATAFMGSPALDRVLLEAERLFPPVPVAPRGVLEDVAIDDHRIPAGTQVFYSAGATHLLPDVWTAPTLFDPDRFAPGRAEHKRCPYALVGFGGGPRTCIGRAFARLLLAALVAHTLRRYHLCVLPGQTIAQRYGVTSRPLHGIRVSVEPRSALSLH